MKKPKLSVRERKLVKNLGRGMTQKDAAIEAGYSDKHPSQSAHNALASIARKMPEVMEKAGLTDESLIEDYLKPLLKATEVKHFAFRKTISVPGKKKTATRPATKKSVRIEQVIEERHVASLGARLNALDMAFKVKGSYAPKQIDFDPDNAVPVTIIDVGSIPRHG